MKNKTIIIIMTCFLSFTAFTQSFFKNKLAVVYDLTYNPKSYIDENEGILALGVIESLKRTNFEHSLTFNYKLMNKLSVALIGGIHANDITFGSRNNTTVEEANYSKINSYSFGAGINLFFKKGLSPSDSHIGLYFKKYQYTIEESDVVNAVFPDYYFYSSSDYIKADGDMKLDMTFIGVKYVYTRMIAKTLPIYYNIGINYTIPIIRKETKSTITTNISSVQSYYPEGNQATTFEYYRNLHKFRINLGLGYIF